MGSLAVSVDGTVRKGSEVSITADFSSTTDIGEAVLSLDYPDNLIEPITHPLYYVNMTADTPLTHTYRIRLLKTGQYKATVNLLVSTDRTDYEQLERTILFDVQENDGQYTLV
jgi:hypothetical protein